MASASSCWRRIARARSQIGRHAEQIPNRWSKGSPIGSSLSTPCEHSSREAAHTPGSDSDFVADAIRAANFCLVPARPSQADIEATHPTLKAVRKLDKEFAFVLNQSPPRGQRPTRVALALNEVGVLALPYIVMRNDHMDSLAAGLAVSEYAPDSPAAAEIRALWFWSKQRVAMTALAKKRTPEHGAALATDARADEANDPLHNFVLQSLRLAALPWAPWLQPQRTSTVKRQVDQSHTQRHAR